MERVVESGNKMALYRGKKVTVSAGIIEGAVGRMLICREQDTGGESNWMFPRFEVPKGDSPEAVLRRGVKRELGIDIEVVIGQPPIEERQGERSIIWRYFVCDAITSDVRTDPYTEVRWIERGHLCEYDFDDHTQPIVDWLMEAEG